MLFILIEKEFRNLLSRKRFLCLAVLIVGSFILSSILLSSAYTRYGERFVNLNPDHIMYHVPITHVFSDVHDGLARLEYVLNPDDFWVQNSTSGGQGNPYLPESVNLNWLFLVQIVVSFAALLSSYNAVTHEREMKTLTLVSSNSVSRIQIYLSKFLSRSVMLSIVLFVAVLAGTIVVFLAVDMEQPFQFIEQALLFLGISIVYIALFTSLGLLVSTFSRTSTLSLVISTVLWIGIVAFAPATIETIASELDGEISELELVARYDGLISDFYNARRNVGITIQENQPYTEQELADAIEKAKQELLDHNNCMVPEMQKELFAIYLHYLHKYDNTARLKRFVPSALYEQTVSTVLHAGTVRFIDFHNQIRDFWRRFVEDMEQRHGIYHVNLSTASIKLDSGWVNYGPERPNYEFNPDLFFEYKPPSLRQSIADGLPGLGALLLMVFGVFLWGLNGFVKCDIT